MRGFWEWKGRDIMEAQCRWLNLPLLYIAKYANAGGSCHAHLMQVSVVCTRMTEVC